MATNSLADSRHTVPVGDQDLEHVSSIAPRVLARLERGRRLFEERYNEIEHLEGDVWSVPSSNLLTGTYLVRLGETPACECADFKYRHVRCYHQIAAQIADSKSRTCSCCGLRVLGRYTSEVSEDDELLSWYPGDVLCAECIRAGYWA